MDADLVVVEGMLDGIGNKYQSFQNCFANLLTTVDKHFDAVFKDPDQLGTVKKIPVLKLIIRISSCLATMVGSPK